MAKIKVNGMIFGRYCTFEIYVENKRLIINCISKNLPPKLIALFEQRLKRCIEAAEPIAGTYYPPYNTLNAVYSGIMNDLFYAGPVHIVIEGELEPIPYDDDPETIY